MADSSVFAVPYTGTTTGLNTGTGSAQTGTGNIGTDIGSLLALLSGLGIGGGQNAWSQIAQIADPWGQQRGQYQTQLNDFMKDPSSVLKDPAFLAAENLGAENISRQAGAAGMANSGNRLADLFSYGQTAGLNFEQQKFNQLSQLAGVNAGSPAAAAGIMGQGLQTQGQNLSTGLAGIGQLLGNLLGLGGSGSGGLLGGIGGLLGNLFNNGLPSGISSDLFNLGQPFSDVASGDVTDIGNYMGVFDNPFSSIGGDLSNIDWGSLYSGLGDLGLGGLGL